jgi:hypothetical protein
MTRSIPAVLTRAAFVDLRTGYLTREGALFLDGLRGAVGGDAATVTPVEPLGALTPVVAFAAPADGLGPLSVPQAPQDGLSPVSAGIDASSGLLPVCGCDMASGLDPVSPIGPESLP